MVGFLQLSCLPKPLPLARASTTVIFRIRFKTFLLYNSTRIRMRKAARRDARMAIREIPLLPKVVLMFLVRIPLAARATRYPPITPAPPRARYLFRYRPRISEKGRPMAFMVPISRISSSMAARMVNRTQVKATRTSRPLTSSRRKTIIMSVRALSRNMMV